MFKILVVEDDRELNRTVCTFLDNSGYVAVGCLDAEDAYDKMYETVFDLIVSDIMMPGIDSFEFAKTVRSLNENIPILFMTARDDFESKQRGFRVGFVMAAYTFYITITAVVNLVKYRKYDSPVMSAAKVISFAAALVSMLSLETAMLSRFGSEDSSPYFDRIMIGATGAGVCVIIVSVSVYMTVRSTKQIKRLKSSDKQGA